jgi:O-acetylserine/cysteine efflux transporter
MAPVSTRHSLLAVLVALVWGLNFVVIDAGLQDVPPLLFLAFRFVLVAFPLVLLVPRPGPWKDVLVIGTFMSLGQFSLLYVALDLGMPAGLASLVLQAQVMFTVVIAAVALGERSTAQQVVGVAVGTVGLLVVALAHGLRAPVLPLLVTVGAALSWAIGNVAARRARMASGLGLVAWSALVVPVPAVLLSLVVDGPAEVGDALAGVGWTAVLSTLYTVVFASLFGYVVWNGLLARYPAGAVVPFILLVPVVGILAAWVVQDEVPTGLEATGGLVMLSGVAIASVRLRRREAVPAA